MLRFKRPIGSFEVIISNIIIRWRRMVADNTMQAKFFGPIYWLRKRWEWGLFGAETRTSWENAAQNWNDFCSAIIVGTLWGCWKTKLWLLRKYGFQTCTVLYSVTDVKTNDCFNQRWFYELTYTNQHQTAKALREGTLLTQIWKEETAPCLPIMEKKTALCRLVLVRLNTATRRQTDIK